MRAGPRQAPGERPCWAVLDALLQLAQGVCSALTLTPLAPCTQGMTIQASPTPLWPEPPQPQVAAGIQGSQLVAVGTPAEAWSTGGRAAKGGVKTATNQVTRPAPTTASAPAGEERRDGCVVAPTPTQDGWVLARQVSAPGQPRALVQRAIQQHLEASKEQGGVIRSPREGRGRGAISSASQQALGRAISRQPPQERGQLGSGSGWPGSGCMPPT